MIHLYRGRQRDIISWGAMQFLTKATTKGRSMQRLEELLLMLLRVAAILALVLALARPMLRSSWLGGGANREVVFLLDNSLSMARTVAGESACDLMIEKALKLVDDLSPSDTVHVLTAAGGGQWLTAAGIPADSAGKRQLAILLQEIEPTRATAKLLEPLQIAVNMEPRDNPASRQIIVLSDNQALSWQPTIERAWRQLGEAREKSLLPTNIEVYACEVPARELENLAVTQLEASRQLVRPEERIDFTAQLSNVGDTTSEETIVEWLVGDQVLGDQVFGTSKLKSLAPEESAQITTQLRQHEAGHFAVTCRIQAEDQIALDRQSRVVIEVSDQLPILLVHDSQAEESEKSADELFTAALGYQEGKPQSVHSIYRPELVSIDELTDTLFANYRAVVILGLTELPGDTNERLQEFVRNGGGLWVTLGGHVDRDTFNRNWYDDGGGISPFTLETLVSVQDTNQPEGSIHPPGKDHPATVQLANTTQLDIDKARLSEYWQLAQSGSVDQKMWVLLESGNGNPLVVENLFGEGRVLLQSFPLDLQWSNLPKLKSYVVMIHDWLDYLAAPLMSRYNLEPGSAILAHVPTGAEFSTANLVTPSGHEVTLVTTSDNANGLVRYSQTQLPGLYRVKFGLGDDEISLSFYVVRDANESDCQPLAASDRTRLIEIAGLQFEGESASTAVAKNTESRPQNEPIWGALLLTLLLLLLGEQLLSHWLTRQRGGVAVSVT